MSQEDYYQIARNEKIGETDNCKTIDSFTEVNFNGKFKQIDHNKDAIKGLPRM